MTILRSVAVISAVVSVLTANHLRAQQPLSDSQAITQFQRAVDAYAFQHRQIERRVGTTPDQRAMAGGIRAARPLPAEGAIFTPVVAAAFRTRIATALTAASCVGPQPGGLDFTVPRPADDAGSAVAISKCLIAALPPLPVELEYRVAGVSMILVDIHANLVVDVLHGAFPHRNN